MKATLLFLAALAVPAFAADDANHGKELFMKLGCWQCHGTQGQGGAYTGPRLTPPPALAVMKAYVRHPSGDMPPYTEKVLDDNGLADIRAYLVSIPKPPDSKGLPGLGK
jgi:mono/diheme cytochrome c family protein